MNQLGKMTLIYVDDEEINLILFREMFKTDFNIHTASSPADALEYLKEHEVDVVLTDHRMPVMTGIEFLKELQKMKPESKSKRLMISGYSPEGEIQDALQNQLLHGFMPKPWTYQQFKGFIASAS
jgi:response regulator RpfG family c-di-GMP phosphodiesterase